MKRKVRLLLGKLQDYRAAKVHGGDSRRREPGGDRSTTKLLCSKAGYGVRPANKFFERWP